MDITLFCSESWRRRIYCAAKIKLGKNWRSQDVKENRAIISKRIPAALQSQRVVLELGQHSERRSEHDPTFSNADAR
jgi:hypothetical protein